MLGSSSAQVQLLSHSLAHVSPQPTEHLTWLSLQLGPEEEGATPEDTLVSTILSPQCCTGSQLSACRSGVWV